MKKYFIITIDTEGDNLWGVKDIKAEITTENARFLPRFQSLCERYGFVPTYLTNYEMAHDVFYREFAREGLAKMTLEVGAHEHSWNQPPYFPLMKSPAHRGKPYLTEYPKLVIREKLRRLTSLLEETFDCDITSHRGGRWSFDNRIAEVLCDLGYVADCTCTPGISWEGQPGWSIRSKGTDWSSWKGTPEIICSGVKERHLVEVPVTVINRGKGTVPAWFRPNGHNCETMLGMIHYLKECGTDYIEFMIHSSELMPGGSPTFKNKGQIDKLYEDIENIFESVKEAGFIGIGLSNYARLVVDKQYGDRS